MGTLTANQQRLPGYCDHKLPTSCRLSSISRCCACADERAHAASYSTYIDGVGYVPRGNRWQRYCWFCKEFWQNRVDASGLRPAQTRIPEVPDQTEFLQRWYEFHQGYRMITRDGVDERVSVVGEDFRDVSPGFLPRTLDEMRAGRQTELAEQEARQREARQREQMDQVAEPTGPSLEEALDQLIGDAEREDNDREQGIARVRNDIHAQSMNPIRTREYQARRIAALRRELNRMRNGIERVMSGLRYLGEEVPDYTEATSRLVELGRTLDNISGTPSQEAGQRAINSVNMLTNSVESRSQADRSLAAIQAIVQEEQRVVDEARRNRDQAASELDLAEQEFRSSSSRLRGLQADYRRTENYIRLFGTREEMLEQGENYESPIGHLFNRALEGYDAAEEVRREQHTLRQILEDEAMIPGPDTDIVIQRLSEIETRERDVWGVPRSGRAEAQPLLQSTNNPDGLQDSRVQANSAGMDGLEDYQTMVQGQVDTVQGHGSTGGLSEVDLRNHNRDSAVAAEWLRDQILSTALDDPDDVSNAALAQPILLAGSSGEQLDPNPSENNDRSHDAQHILFKLSTSAALRSRLNNPLDVREIEPLLSRVSENSLTVADRTTIEGLLDTPMVVWETGLPSERNYRRRRRGEEVTFTPDALDMARGGLVTIHDVEVMAECFQLSSELRSRSELVGVELLHMLSRLQRGQRTPTDRDVLSRMIRNRTTLNLARDLQSQITGGQPRQAQTDRRAALERDRQESARRGDFSRAELDAQRRAMHAFALAAGRSAMQTGPTALLAQIASGDDASQAAYQRLRDSGYIDNARDRTTRYRPLSLDDFTAAPSASDSDHEHESDNEGRGLDAQDSGRPDEPMTDEDMTVKLDCRICYSQLADVACLPCGHLVMCRWCSEQHSPVMSHDRTRPRRPAGCPVCRKGIRQKVRMFRA